MILNPPGTSAPRVALLLKVQLLRELSRISVRINQNTAIAVSNHALAQYCFATTTISTAMRGEEPDYGSILSFGQGKRGRRSHPYNSDWRFFNKARTRRTAPPCQEGN
jgi:hypothetical protein